MKNANKKASYGLEFAPKSSIFMRYDEAILYCQFLDYRGYKDWRLPTHDEYNRITTLSGWCQDGPTAKKSATMLVSPVRDI
jgi:hypothetical protein